MKRILIVEDEPYIMALVERLSASVFPQAEIRKAPTLKQARQHLEWVPELLLLDLSLPDGRGHELIPLARKKHTAVFCVVLTSFEDDDYLFPALQAGANGYLLKEHRESELRPMFEDIVAGKPVLSPSIANKILAYFTKAQEEGPHESLTQREKEALACVAKGNSLRQCAEMIGISPNTAAGYLKEAYRKLHINTRAEASIKALKMGLIQ